MKRISVIDSHTEGEPTRTVISGGPDLGDGPLADRLTLLRERHDDFRSAVVNEPRGSDVLVGALLCEPFDPTCTTGVIFFNNVGYLGMCGHGAIGLTATLAHLNRIDIGDLRIETPVGIVTATWHGDGTASIVNVPSARRAANIEVEVEGLGRITGDIAWSGNWFFLTKSPRAILCRKDVDELTDLTLRIRQAVNAQGYPQVDHVELFADPQNGGNSRNFVLCPGGAYDRSPCGTGTSAKLACLAADGRLAEREEWIQESIVGTHFRASYRWLDHERGLIVPTITGRAHITAESTLLFEDHDPFRTGIR